MKKVFLRLTTIVCFSIFAGSVSAQNYYMSKPEGFGAGVTGGGTPTSSNTVTVTTASELSTALSSSKSVILVSGTITTSRISVSITNKTILGLTGAKLVSTDTTASGSGILYLNTGSKNVIIRNLIFQGPAAYDVDGYDCLTNKGCNKLWVDHCEFRDGLDDSYDNTGKSDSITVSWCKFTHLLSPVAGGSGGSNDHRYACLIGGSDSDYPADGRYSITWQNCWFGEGNKDRMVRGRNVELHFISCYWNSSVASHNISLTAGTNGCTVYCENGVFAGSGPYMTLDKTGTFDCQLVNCKNGSGTLLSNSNITLTNSAANLATITAPSYTYTTIATDSVAAAITNSSCGAGATLLVAADGTISLSSGSSSVVPVVEKSSSYKCYPSKVEDVMNIDFPNNGNRSVAICIYTASGQKVSSFSKTIVANEKIELDLQYLDAGIYFINIQDNSGSFTNKFIKL